MLNGVTWNRIARFNADGTLDRSFDPGVGPNSDVYSILPRPNGDILVGGPFSVFAGQPSSAYLVRLFRDGSVDSTFTGGPTQLCYVSPLTRMAGSCLEATSRRSRAFRVFGSPESRRMGFWMTRSTRELEQIRRFGAWFHWPMEPSLQRGIFPFSTVFRRSESLDWLEMGRWILRSLPRLMVWYIELWFNPTDG